jgi:hypothetical protein
LTNRFPHPTPPWRLWRPRLLAASAFVALIAAPSADALTHHAHSRAPRPAQGTAPRQAGEPIMAIVSLKTQHVTIYDADGWILRAPVSSGMRGRETPAGVFSVIQKDKDHHSNLYDDAYMPNMLRITWSGIALHGGPLPGHAASHGCVRMPYSFAEHLFPEAKVGMRVIIAPNDATPVDIVHPALFSPKPEAEAHARELAAAAADAAKAAEAARLAAVTATRDAARASAAVRKLEFLKARADAQLAAAERAADAAAAADAKAHDAKAGDAKTGDAKTGDAKTGDAKTDDTKAGDTKTGEAKADDTKVNDATARTALAKQQAAARVADLQAQLDAAKTDEQAKLDAVTAAREAAKAADSKRADTLKAAHEAAPARISVFISRKKQRIYVRRGFEPIVDAPITIRDPDQPIGTHVFTAVARTNQGFRWTDVTIERAGGESDAKSALDRITIPPDVLDRIESMAAVDSSLIISDEALSGETGKGTEFVAVLTDQPQGGLAMRHHSTGLVRYARRREFRDADNGYQAPRGYGYPQQRSFFGGGWSTW